MDKEQLLSTEIKEFIKKHESDNLSRLMLQRDKYPGLPLRDIADQIMSRKKAKLKLPSWYSNESILYPNPLSIEQSSSELTAQWKAEYMGQGEYGVDLTGGFGVDSYYLSKKFKHWSYIESNKELFDLAPHNFGILGATNIEIINSTAEEYIAKQKTHLDIIYIDPDRRPDNKRVSGFKDSRPNIIELLPYFINLNSQVLIKASPMVDIKACLMDLKSVVNVIVLAAENEVKEVLFHLSFDQVVEPTIRAINLVRGHEFNFYFKYSEELQEELKTSLVSTYLYEPNAAILKSGAFKTVNNRFGLTKLNKNTHLYTSKEVVSDFPGRTFSVLANVNYSHKEIAAALPDLKANVSTRNFIDTSDQMKKKLKIKDGGDVYLFGYRDLENRNKVAICKKA